MFLSWWTVSSLSTLGNLLNLCPPQEQRDELHRREGLEGPIWCRYRSGWQAQFLQWQEEVCVSVCAVHFKFMLCFDYFTISWEYASRATAISHYKTLYTAYTHWMYYSVLCSLASCLYYFCVFCPRPFRRVTDKGALLWDRIHRLEKGQIYKQVIIQYMIIWDLFFDKLVQDILNGIDFLFSCVCLCFFIISMCFIHQGNLYEFLRLTSWRGSKVLYFGDHIYSDLAVSSQAYLHLQTHKTHSQYIVL